MRFEPCVPSLELKAAAPELAEPWSKKAQDRISSSVFMDLTIVADSRKLLKWALTLKSELPTFGIRLVCGSRFQMIFSVVSELQSILTSLVSALVLG
jgi:hypothetical protein